MDPGGRYTPKAGYIKLSADVFQRVLIWWWKKPWKIKSPPKTRIFMWCVLENKAPTWDNLQKRCFQGLGWCDLCKADGESIIHLFLHHPFIK